MLLKAGDTILFQGDSVTDCGRSREDDHYLGGGYPKMIADKLASLYPVMNLKVINRGVSGDRVKNLAARWDADCVAVQPTVLTILIGINDTWRRYDSNDPTSTEAYLTGYRSLLERAKGETPVREIILMDPFVLPTPLDRKAWREDLNPRIDGLRDIAREFGARYIPLDGIFAEASCGKPCEYWAADGVHPTEAGHGLIADTWLSKVAG